MRGLGRLIALPFLLIALALQGLAPAQAQAMPRDAFGSPMCLGGGQSHPQDSQHGPAHDCCAAACLLAGLSGDPPALPHAARIAFGAPIAFHLERRTDGLADRAVSQPRARGPPTALQTI